MKKAIYKITNKLNNKSYIGQSKDPIRRFKEHKWDALNPNCKEKSALHDAIVAVGIENFNIEILGWYDDYNEKEKYFINYFDTLVPNGYNIMSGGEEPPHRYGEEHHNSKYSQELIDNIINDLLTQNFTLKQIEDKYGVNEVLVSSINRGATHYKENIDYPIVKESNYYCNKKEVEQIKYLLKNSMCSSYEIADYFNINRTAVTAINQGRNYYDENICYPIRKGRGKVGMCNIKEILERKEEIC